MALYWSVCEGCRGVGYLDEERFVTCKQCGGTGKVLVKT